MEIYYNEELLRKDRLINGNRDYQQCRLSVMDTISDPDIWFDDQGICNYYQDYKAAEQKFVLKGEEADIKRGSVIKKIKADAKGNKYDSILGLSGGVDSSYLAYYTREIGLNPLLVHFDYGWNSELAVYNIENIVKQLNLDLYTYVMDWEEFRDLQRSYFKASVLDLDIPADHMIFGALYEVAKSKNIKYILSGKNIVTEATLPRSWNYHKFDLVNLKNIHQKYGTLPLKKLPALGAWEYSVFTSIRNIKTVEMLNWIPYNKAEAKNMLMDKLGWKDYGGKHYESVFTRFYQGYILPYKFHIDKRKAHLSNLIFSGQITRDEALHEIEKPIYASQLMLEEDKAFVAKKLGFGEKEFEGLLKLPNRLHEEFGTDQHIRKRIKWIVDTFKPAFGVVKKLIR